MFAESLTPRPELENSQDPTATTPRVGSRARSFRRLFGVLARRFAHQVDVISQHVELARKGDGHSEVVCLLLEAVEPPSLGGEDHRRITR